MNNLSKIFLSNLIILIASSIILSGGCTRREEEGKGITLRWYFWHGPKSETLGNKKIALDFEERYPGIKIERMETPWREYYTKLQSMISGGTVPDLVWLEQHKYLEYVERGVLLPLDPYIKGDKDFDLSDFPEEIVQTQRYRGYLYGLPCSVNFGLIFYNKDLFDKEGISYPSQNWTWDEFLETAKRLTKDTNGDGRTDRYGVSMSSADVFIWQNGGEIFNKEMTECLIDSPEAIEALEFYRDLFRKYHVMPTPTEQVDMDPLRAFETDRIAMLFSGWHSVTSLEDDIKNFEWDVAPLPQQKKKATWYSTLIFAIPKESKNPEKAWKFISFFTSTSSAKIYFYRACTIPTRKSLRYLALEGRMDDKRYEEVLQELKYGHPFIPFPEIRERIILPNLDLFYLGKMDAKETTSKIKREVDNILKERAKD